MREFKYLVIASSNDDWLEHGTRKVLAIANKHTDFAVVCALTNIFRQIYPKNALTISERYFLSWTLSP